MHARLHYPGEMFRVRAKHGDPKPEVVNDARDHLTHVPALLNALFDYPRSTARMMIALGNVSLNGVKLTVDDLDIPWSKLQGATIHCAQHTAILSRVRPDAVMESSPMDPLMEMGGI